MAEDDQPKKQPETERGGSGRKGKTAVGAGEGGGFDDFQGLPLGAGDPPLSTPLRAVIADRSPLIQQGLTAMLWPFALTVNCSGDGAGVLGATRSLKPDLVLMDVDLDVFDGVEATRRVHAEMPRVRIIITTDLYHATKYFYQLTRAGALAFCLKSSGRQVLLEAIGKVVLGQKYCDMRISKAIEQKLNASQNEFGLSPREVEVLVRLDLPNKEIAEELDMKLRTVEKHIEYLLTKMKVPTRTSAALVALRMGLVLLPLMPSRDPVTGVSLEQAQAERLAKEAIGRPLK